MTLLQNLRSFRVKDGKEGRRSFLVLVASFLCQLITEGFLFGADLLPPVLAAYFHRSDGEILLLASLLQAPQFLCGPVSGYLTNRFGPRRVIMIFGACAGLAFFGASFFEEFWAVMAMAGITGVSLGLYSVPKVTAVSFHFSLRWRTFATTVATVGGTLGSAIFPFVFQSLLWSQPWQSTFVYLSCFLLQPVVCGAFMGLPSTQILDPDQDSPRELVQTEFASKKKEEDARTADTPFPLGSRPFLRRVVYPLFLFHGFLWTLAEWADTIFPLWMTAEGMSPFNIAVLITVTTSASVLGRIIASSLTLLTKKHILLFSNMTLVLMAGSNWVLLSSHGFHQFVAAKALQGLIFGTACGFTPGIILELVGLDRFNAALGTSHFVVGVAGVFSPPLAGRFVDATGSYRELYKGMSALVILSLCIMLPFQWPFTKLWSSEGTCARSKTTKRGSDPGFNTVPSNQELIKDTEEQTSLETF